jgi:hypothetical protein
MLLSIFKQLISILILNNKLYQYMVSVFADNIFLFFGRTCMLAKVGAGRNLIKIVGVCFCSSCGGQVRKKCLATDAQF